MYLYTVSDIWVSIQNTSIGYFCSSSISSKFIRLEIGGLRQERVRDELEVWRIHQEFDKKHSF